MPSPTTILIDKLARLVGTPKCPALVDVRTDEDFAADARLIPGSFRRSHLEANRLANQLHDRPALVICQRGKRLSDERTDWLRRPGTAS